MPRDWKLKDFVLAQLDQQQSRRDRQLPQVTVLVGSANAALDYWRNWAGRCEREFLLSNLPWGGQAVREWVAKIVQATCLPAHALARRPAPPEGDREKGRRQLRETSRPGRDRRRANVEITTASAENERLGRWLFELAVEGREREACEPALLASALGLEWEQEAQNLLTALAHFLPPRQFPALLWVPADDVGSRTAPEVAVTASLQCLSKLALALPSIPIGIGMARNQYERWLAATPESHAKGLLRAGRVDLPGLREEELQLWIEGQYGQERGADAAALAASLRARGLTLGAVGSALAVSGTADPPPTAPNDAARSQAERFVFGILEAAPETAGLFELNGWVEEDAGEPALEVDLLSRSVRIAIELDGYYHFQDRARYRRDRDKDFQLQRRGYLVRRYLAEDVVPELENILADIAAALALRQTGFS